MPREFYTSGASFTKVFWPSIERSGGGGNCLVLSFSSLEKVGFPFADANVVPKFRLDDCVSQLCVRAFGPHENAHSANVFFCARKMWPKGGTRNTENAQTARNYGFGKRWAK